MASASAAPVLLAGVLPLVDAAAAVALDLADGLTASGPAFPLPESELPFCGAIAPPLRSPGSDQALLLCAPLLLTRPDWYADGDGCSSESAPMRTASPIARSGR